MKKILLLLITAFFCLVRPAVAGTEIVVLQSSRLIPYEQARLGVERVLAAGSHVHGHGPKSIQPEDLSLFVLSEETNLQVLRFVLETRHPEVVVAIGGKALAFAVGLKIDTPIVYLLVPSPTPIIKERPMVTGVKMVIPPDRQLAGLAAVLPKVKRIGAIYDPDKSGALIAQAQQDAARLGIEILAEKAGSPKHVPDLLTRLRGQIDAFWIVPDLTVVTPHTMEQIFIFSASEKVPVLSFSEKYLEAGAAVAVSFDLVAMGEEAAGLVWDILHGRKADQLPPVLPEKVKIGINRKVLDKIGVDYNPKTATAGSAEAMR